MFLTVTQGKGKLRPFVKRVDKTVVRADKKILPKGSSGMWSGQDKAGGGGGLEGLKIS